MLSEKYQIGERKWYDGKLCHHIGLSLQLDGSQDDFKGNLLVNMIQLQSEYSFFEHRIHQKFQSVL